MLNRDVRNAVNEHATRRLGEIVRKIEEDRTLRVAILTGAGDRAFCAGADLKAISAGKLPELLTKEGGFVDFVMRKRSKIWVAAMNGEAMAAGLEIMLACDFAIAADHATFALPEVNERRRRGTGVSGFLAPSPKDERHEGKQEPARSGRRTAHDVAPK